MRSLSAAHWPRSPMSQMYTRNDTRATTNLKEVLAKRESSEWIRGMRQDAGVFRSGIIAMPGREGPELYRGGATYRPQIQALCTCWGKRGKSYRLLREEIHDHLPELRKDVLIKLPPVSPSDDASRVKQNQICLVGLGISDPRFPGIYTPVNRDDVFMQV